MKKFLVALVLFTMVLFSVACTQIKPQPIITQESLLQKCSADTPLPENFKLDLDGKKVYTGEEIYKVLLKWQFMYNTCAVMHDKLVDAIIDLQFDRMMILQKEE